MTTSKTTKSGENMENNKLKKKEQKCMWVYVVVYNLIHYFETEEEADIWWLSYKAETNGDVEGAIEKVWIHSKSQKVE